MRPGSTRRHHPALSLAGLSLLALHLAGGANVGPGLAAAPAAGDAPAPRPPDIDAPPPFVFKDQFGRQDGPGRQRGRVVLLLYGGPASVRRMRAWEEQILEHGVERPGILRVIDARSLHGVRTEAEVDERLRRAAAPGASILIDWNGDLARGYGFPRADVLATVLDTQGRSCGTVTGPVEREGLSRIRATLARVGGEGSCP